jgi:hypothetical protein
VDGWHGCDREEDPEDPESIESNICTLKKQNNTASGIKLSENPTPHIRCNFRTPEPGMPITTKSVEMVHPFQNVFC